MGDPSTDHYEQQLYAMFKSFDINNEDSLDETAVNNLCDALQLEERGAALVDTLFERRSGGRVSFAQFRSGLLGVLGERAPPDPPPPGVDDVAGRELEPKFVFGSKKYGRRSRPALAAAAGDEPRAASASRVEPEPRTQRPRCRRSTSALERRDDEAALEHDRLIGREDAVALCRSLRMHSIDRRLIERIFEDSPSTETTVGEFFDRLNSSLASAMSDENAVADASVSTEREDAESPLTAERVAEAWEGAGVRRPRRLLADLGFAGGGRARVIERAIDEELRSFEEPLEGRGALLAAALALVRLRAADAERRRELAAAERDKLRADVAEANERARLLAREVDESHARIENELKANVKRAEVRHAEEMRRAAAEAAAEREVAAADVARLGGELSRVRDGESRLRAEMEALRRRCEELEARATGAEERSASSDREVARLGVLLRDAEAAAASAAQEADKARAAATRACELAQENQRLRDRADELAAALEERAPAAHSALSLTPSEGGALATELDSLLLPKGAEDATTDATNVGAGNDSDEEKTKLTELVKELELSLEAMRGEYEACEEYWGGKLAEERAAHDAEARAAAERLADLTARIADFERRLLPPALPAIPEAAALEAQVEDLQAEFARYRRDSRARLASLTERLARAERRRPAPAPAPELAARCARAEAAVRQLHARLATADLLVKELFVENCHLAHARPLPL